MIRLAVPGASVLVVLAASGCGAVPDSAVAVRTGDSAVSIDQVESVLRAVASAEGSGVVADEATGTVEGDFARNVVSIFVTRDATKAFLAANGEAITEEDRQAVLDQIPEDDPGRDYPQDLFDLLVELNAGPMALARIEAPAAPELEERYAASPGDLDVLCVRHVLLDSESAADDVLAEVAAGASIEDLARERSTDPTAVDNGGAIELTQGQACSSVTDARQALDPVFVDAAVTAVPGEPVGPIQTDFGWHVIEARPYAEVAESLATVFETGAGDLLFASYLRDLDVNVDPRYGRWDGTAGQVVPL